MDDYAFNNRGPSYIRLTGVPGSPIVYYEDYQYTFNKIVTLKSGTNVLIISTGSVVSQALLAAKLLKTKNISCSVVNLHTLKPLDKKINKIIGKYNFIVTVEEHTIIGGLSSIISELVVKIKIIQKY